MELKKLVKETHDMAKQKGFWDGERNIGEKLMLIVSELGEALEAHRTNRFADLKKFEECGKNDSCFEQNVKDTFEDELADVFIRLADLCGAFNLDIEKFIELKMKYNSNRQRLHGKKY